MPLGPTHDLGPAICVWGSTKIEQIFEEVRWTFTGESAKVFEALYGVTAVDSVFLGYSACSITIPATRIALATLALLLPGGTNSGGASGAIQVKAAGTGAPVGISMYDSGFPLFVKATTAGVAVANGKWLRLEHAYPVPNFDVVFAATAGSQRTYGLTFEACPDATTKQLWSVGKVATGASY